MPKQSIPADIIILMWCQRCRQVTGHKQEELERGEIYCGCSPSSPVALPLTQLMPSPFRVDYLAERKG